MKTSTEYTDILYGTKIAKGLITFCFVHMKSEFITADLCVEDVKSVKILNKFFTIQKEFYNAQNQCVDRRYIVKKLAIMYKNNNRDSCKLKGSSPLRLSFSLTGMKPQIRYYFYARPYQQANTRLTELE